MQYFCPVCNKELFLLNKKLICPNEDCSFQSVISNFTYSQMPWYIQKCKDDSIWNLEVFDSYPFFISMEYKRLYDLLNENKLYGVLFQIKDIFEVLLKLPVLLIINKYCNNKKRGKREDKIICSLLDKKLSLGHWFNIAKSCTYLDDGSEIMTVLKNIVSVYQDNDITNWRNDTIGHGALMFDNTQSFRDDLVSKLLLIKIHLDECKEQYKSVNLTYKSKGRFTKLVGCGFDKTLLRNNGKIYFYSAGTKYEINEFMRVENGGIYFFDSYYKKEKKTKLLNYIDAEMIKIRIHYFDEMIKNVSKYIKIENQITSVLDSQIYIESEEVAVEFINSVDDSIVQEKLKAWINKNISDNSKGSYLLQMEEGMGKTTFSHMLDPHSKNIIKMDGVAVRAFYINSSYSFNIEIFKNNVIEKLQLNNAQTDKIKGNIPKFNSDTDCLRKEFADILAGFLSIYKEKYGVDKLLFIIDGLDEIPFFNELNIIDFIPGSDDLQDGVYVLATMRTKSENIKYLNEKVDKINFNDTLDVRSDDKDYINTLKNFIKNKLKINNQDIIDNIIANAENKFLYIRPIYYILKNKSIDNIDTSNIFTEYLDILEKTYSEKYYNKIIDILVILAISREGIVISEISYLLNGEKPDFKLLAYLADINCLLEKKRTFRGSVLSIAHSSIKDYIFLNYKERVKKKCREWKEEVISLDFSVTQNYHKYLIFNIIYFIKTYLPIDMNELLQSPNMNIDYVYKMFVKLDINAYDLHGILQYMDDTISYMEKNSKSYVKELIRTYLTRSQVYLSYAFGGNETYYNYIDRAIEIAEKCRERDHNTIAQAYILNADYYRRIGNSKKSLEFNKLLGDYITKINSKGKLRLELSINSSASVLLSQSINLKNEGEIEEAITISLEAEKLVKDNEDYEAKMIYSNILNNLGLCYLKNKTIDNLALAEKNIRKSIEIMEDVIGSTGIKDNEIYYNYANLGQVLRSKGDLDSAFDIYNDSIGKFEHEEKKGRLNNKNQIALLHNGRANIYRDLAQIKNDLKLYEDSISDYKMALNYLVSAKDDNRNIALLANIYTNLISLYETTLDDKENANEYKKKFQEIRRNIFKKENDIFNEDELSVDEQMNITELYQLFDKSNKHYESNRYIKAVEEYREVLKLISIFSNVKDHYIVKEIEAKTHYNLGCALHSMLQIKLMENFNSKRIGLIPYENYDEYSPNDIISELLLSDETTVLDDKERSTIFRIISNVYCEVLKDYKLAQKYAEDALSLDNNDQAYLCLGNAFYEQEKYYDAKKNYQKAEQINPTDIAIKQNIEATNLKISLKLSNKFI